MVKIGINGFGRVGRLVLRASLKKEVQVVAINEPYIGLDYIMYLIKYDSTHGRFEGKVETRDGKLYVNDNEIALFKETDPSVIAWSSVNAEYIVEASGRFNDKPEAEEHLQRGAKKVVITGLSTKYPNIVFGVNHESYESSSNVIATSSCTTNALAPLAMLLHENFEIIEGMATSVHAVTSEQKTVDTYYQKFPRGGRCLNNIIPYETGAQDISEIIPALYKKVKTMAFRVPVTDVSVIDFTVRFKSATSAVEIKRKVKEASEGPLKGILGYTEEKVVSSDFITDKHSAVFDAGALMDLDGNGNFFKLISWYDNEYGYACRVVDMIKYMSSRSKQEKH